MGIIDLNGQFVKATGQLEMMARLMQEGVDWVFNVGVCIPSLNVAAA